MSTQKRRSNKNKQRKSKGGAGAAEHVASVAGGPGEQVVMPGSGNQIQLHAVAPVVVGGADPMMGKTSMAPAPVTGGKSRKSKKGLDGGNLIDLALPVAFVGIRSMYTKRKSNKKYMGKRTSKSSRRR
jgi:hypothetical protein